MGLKLVYVFLHPATASGEGAASCHSHFTPHGQLIFTSVSGLLVLDFPVNFLISFIPFLKILFFLSMSRLSSLLFCVRFFLCMSFSAFRISSERRLVQFMCCRTSFWRVGLRCGNPSPRMAFRVPSLILPCGCGGFASARAAFRREISCRKLFWFLVLCSFLSPAHLRAFLALSCTHLTSLASISCSFLMRSASDWQVGSSSRSPRIWFLVRVLHSSAYLLKKTVSILWEKSGG